MTKKKTNRKAVFTVSVSDITETVTYEDELTVVQYESAEEAMESARIVATILSVSYRQVFSVTVFRDGFVDRWGNVQGEPCEIYTISSRSKGETMRARRNAGYVSLEVDEYTDIVPNLNSDNMEEKQKTIVVAIIVTSDGDGNLSMDMMRFGSVKDAMDYGAAQADEWVGSNHQYTLDEEEAEQLGRMLCVKSVMGSFIEVSCTEDKSEFDFFIKEFEI